MSQRSPLAVVGYAYRAPGVGRKGLFEFLEQGRSAWSKVPTDRFNHDAYYHPDKEKSGFISSQGGHFLPDDIYAFDPAFFNIKAEEARSMDPQHRLLLECAFEAAEDAGLTLHDLMGANIGVFAASDKSEYYNSEAQDLPTASIYTATGVNPCMFANRLSYFFGLTGPSVAVDAACASSCSAVHIACQSILAGECSAAFVGGAKTLNGPNQWIELDTMGTLSAEGKCFSYDVRASGFGRGEGAACIIIKLLSDALTSGDPVRSIIRNSASNHSGRTQGISMPGRASQEKLLSRLHQEIGLDPNETTFVEGHGTGTQVGDPIEAGAISSVIASRRSPSDPLYIGSVKSNLGHLENASGLISVIKCIMMLEHEVMLPNANFTEFNPNIEGRERLKVLTNSTPWPVGASKRVCISNFGFGGSNAALLLEAAPKALYGHTDSGIVEHLFVFSAKSQMSLGAYMSSFLEYLETKPCANRTAASDLAFTLGLRRTHFAYRATVTADSTDSLKHKLQMTSASTKSGITKDPVLVFAFTGQGAQYSQMGTGLLRFRKFAEAILAAEQLLLQLGATWSLTDELDKQEHESRIDDADISQPACTALQLALVILLQSWGVLPAAVLGHSSGEIAAAFAAGILSFEAAIAIAYFRGVAASRILQDTTVQGAMLAVGASIDEAKKLFPQNDDCYAVIAAVNSYGSVTISGDLSTIEHIQEQAQEQGLFVRRLKVGLAYHSHHMERVAASYLASIRPFCSSDLAILDAQPTKPLFISTVTGQVEPADSVDARYWVRNLLQPVQYLKAVETLFSEYYDNEGAAGVPNILIEIGPHSALQNPTKQILERITLSGCEVPREQVTYFPSLVRGKRATTAMLDLAGKLYVTGLMVKFDALNQTTHSRVQVVNDLPSYEWNKTVRYIHRPRLASQKLYGGGKYNTLLGWKSPYSEGREQAFRNVFTLDDLPWIRDHVVTGRILFPFTGFVSLAVEAFKLLNTTVAGVVIRELHVTTSLEIEEDQRVDITTKFRPAETGTETLSSVVWAFEILSWSGADGWKRHSHGFIEADHSDEPFLRSLTVQAALKTLDSQALQQRNAEHEYTLLRENNGIAYGPAFRNTVDFWQAPGVVVHTMVLRQIELDTHGSPEVSPMTVDAPTLDAIFHSLGAIQEKSGPRPIIVPTFCSRWRISNKIAADAGQRFSIVSRLLSCDEKSGNMHMDFVVFDVSGVSPKPVAEIGPLKLQCIAQTDGDNIHLPDTFTFRDVPYIDLMDASTLSKMLQGDAPGKGELSHRHDLDQVAIYFLSRTLEAEHDMSGSPPHLANFLGWARRVVAENPSALIPDAEALIDRVSSSNATGELVCAVGAQLSAILRGEKQPLEIMLEDGLLWRTYAENVAGIRANLALARYIERLAECNADLNILELGAGTASATLPILEAIQRATRGAASQFTYTFTDISAGFFEKAQTTLSQWAERTIYSKLDISQDPLLQGFSAQSYDVVLASNVLHATSDIVSTLSNVRSLLKPGGKLVLMEGVNSPPPSFLPYALLPGWWLFEDNYRTDGPLLTRDLWNSALEANGFSGIEGYVDDYPGQPEQLFSALWSSRCDPEATATVNEVSAVTVYQCSDDEDCKNFANVVSNNLERQFGGNSTVKHLLDRHTNDDQSLCIVLDGRTRSMFSDISSEMFYNLKDLLLKSSRLLWVLPETAHPDATMIRGMLRTLRLEMPSSRLVLCETPLNAESAAAMTRLVQHIIRSPSSAIRQEQEYSLINNTLHVPRLQLVKAPKEIFAIEAGVLVKSEQSLWEADKALEITVDTVGSPDSVYFQQSRILDTDLADHEIVVRVEAAGINFIDLLTVLGSLSWSPPGLEGAGVVARIGSQVEDLQVGDRVFYAVDKAGMANFVRMPGACAHRIPEGLDPVEAASLPIAYITAILSLIEVGRLQKGETVLIHSASGAVGQACVLLAQHIGAQVVATAGTAQKREFLTQTFGIPTSRIFCSRTPDFKDGVLQTTDNRGVDVVVNCLSGHLLRHTWDLIAENGRFIEIGKKDFVENSYLPMRHFIRNVTFSGVDVRRIISTKPAAVKEWLSTISHMVREGAITPIRPITNVPVSQVKTGLRKLQAGQNIGKVVVTLGYDESVLAKRASPFKGGLRASTLLKSDATYVVAGGTGGIGRALVPWMISKGARNVIMLGRSASSNPKVKELLKTYEGTNIRVRAIPCDVGSRTDMVRASQALRDLPRVHGVVHSAICLSDAIFANLEFQDWQQTTSSRVQGAWLLHELYPNLDFFVSLSGMTGIVGNSAQSVYTGTSTFLEAFTDYRVKLGLPASVIHLPPVEGIGRVAELDIGKRLKSSIGGILTGAEVFTLVEGAIIGPSSGLGIDGRYLSWSLVSASDVEILPWEHLNPLSVMRRQRKGPHSMNHSHTGKKTSQDALKTGSPEFLLAVLGDKVSSMTAMDRDEITPTRSLIDYGLDSLISLELRNWIRRNFEVDMQVNDINASTDLKAVMDYIVSHMKRV
ncbi:putative polyketide synthase [Xylariales sp. AK1849]|nr:putative polyketide synthase [Xylariales sp. AK1849]